MTDKVALVTGGATGMGRAVVQALVARGNWHVHIVDVKPTLTSPSSAQITYHQADISNYAQLASVFKTAFIATGRRLDFVFANAGILDSANYFTNGDHSSSSSSSSSSSNDPADPPPEPEYNVVKVNLFGCVNTARLARHYMSESPESSRNSRAIAITASQSAIWPTYCLPLYTASKDGVMGFARSISDWYAQSDGIRVNVLCPSAVETDLLPQEAWDGFRRSDSLTSMELVVKVVLMFCDGDLIEDSRGKRASRNYGQTVVPAGEQIYLSDHPEFTNEGHREMAEATRVDRQAHIVG